MSNPVEKALRSSVCEHINIRSSLWKVVYQNRKIRQTGPINYWRKIIRKFQRTSPTLKIKIKKKMREKEGPQHFPTTNQEEEAKLEMTSLCEAHNGAVTENNMF